MPERALPTHPDFQKTEEEKKAENKVENPHLEYFLKLSENKEKKKEFTAAMVSEMLIQNASSQSIEDKLM